jgi:hypothetical protein
VPELLTGPFDRWAFASRRTAEPAAAAALSETVIAALVLLKRREGEAVIQVGVPSPEEAAAFAPLLVPAGAFTACITASPPLAAAFLFAMLDVAHRSASPVRPERALSSLAVAAVVSDATVLVSGTGPFAGCAPRLVRAGWAAREIASPDFEERHARRAAARLARLSDVPATPYRQEPPTQ